LSLVKVITKEPLILTTKLRNITNIVRTDGFMACSRQQRPSFSFLETWNKEGKCSA